jgi:drug/metabolite transporter (DMT)-like permease
MLTSLTPIFTMVLSFCFNGEKFKTQEIFFTFITLSAVTAISMGMTFENNKSIDHDNKISLQGIVFAALGISIPLIHSVNNIITSKMKNLHENTVSLFVNPSMFIIMYLIILGKN